MRSGPRDRERFWIAFIVRFAFGFLFLIAAVNAFTYLDKKGVAVQYPENAGKLARPFHYLHANSSQFAAELGKPFESTWINFKWKWWPIAKSEEIGIRPPRDLGKGLVHGFLYSMPYILAALAACILTGICLRPALRFGAFYLVMLGLGKYITGDGATTAQDFIYAAFICIGLYMASEEKQVRLELIREEFGEGSEDEEGH